jgi:hypothetical protein
MRTMAAHWASLADERVVLGPRAHRFQRRSTDVEAAWQMVEDELRLMTRQTGESCVLLDKGVALAVVLERDDDADTTITTAAAVGLMKRLTQQQRWQTNHACLRQVSMRRSSTNCSRTRWTGTRSARRTGAGRLVRWAASAVVRQCVV